MKSSPRISSLLMTTDTVGGVWTYALELCRAMPDIRIILASMGPPSSAAQREQIAQLTHVELVESELALEWMEDPWDDVALAGDWLLELESLHSPDLIHLNGYAHGSLPWRAPVLVVAHSCVLSWWEAVKREPAPPRYANYRDEVTRGIAAADAVVAPSAAMLQCIARHYGPPRRAMVIPNAVSPQRFRQPIEKEPLVLCAGRLWDEAKNAMAVAEIAKNLPWPVVLAGETGGIPPEFPNVRFTGHCKPMAMAMWFLKASIYVHPARYEPFGLTVLEAAHTGAALVLADIPSLREIWGDAAWFVDPDEPRALEEAVLTLIKHPQLREDLGNQARRRAARHQVTQMRDTYLSIYQSIILMSRKQQLDPA